MITKALKNRLSRSLTIFLFLLSVSSFTVWFENVSYVVQENRFTLTLLNIGQGDSMLIKTPNNYYVLIDTGKGNTVLSELEKALPYNYREIDYMILTHPDSDHIEGALTIINYYKISKVFMNEMFERNPLQTELKNRLKEKDIAMNSLYSTDDFDLDGVRFDVIWPNTKDILLSETNDTSISIKITYNNFDLVTMGDLPSIIEDQLLPDIGEVEALKVSHHGSKYSTSKRLLEVLKPKISLISAGLNNSYGHPHAIVTELLKEAKCSIFRTDYDGMVNLKTDGTYINIETSSGNSQQFTTK